MRAGSRLHSSLNLNRRPNYLRSLQGGCNSEKFLYNRLQSQKALIKSWLITFHKRNWRKHNSNQCLTCKTRKCSKLSRIIKVCLISQDERSERIQGIRQDLFLFLAQVLLYTVGGCLRTATRTVVLQLLQCSLMTPLITTYSPKWREIADG